MEQYKFAYLTGCFLFGIIWLLIYKFRPDLRKEQLFMSYFISIFGLTEHLFFGSYWKPQFIFSIPGFNVGIESILLCFFYGGITSTLYEFVFSEHLKRYRKIPKSKRVLEIDLAIFLGSVLLFMFWLIFNINIIYSNSLAFIAVGTLFIWYRRDLFIPALLNGVIVSIVSFLILVLFGFLFKGIFDSWWQLNLLSGIRLLSVPVEEIIWHFCLGFAAGPMYEVWKGYTDSKAKVASSK